MSLEFNYVLWDKKSPKSGDSLRRGAVSWNMDAIGQFYFIASSGFPVKQGSEIYPVE